MKRFMAADLPKDKYLVPVAAKTLDILEVFRTSQEELTLGQITRRTGIAHTTAFRILHTLVSRGYVLQGGSGKLYRRNIVRQATKIGFATLTMQTSFASAITKGLEVAAEQSGIELIVRNNDLDPDIAIQNAEAFVRDKVDVAIEFQRHEQAAPVIAEIFAAAGIPTVAVINQQPGAIYFGVNNYQAGLTAGRALAAHSIEKWEGQADALLLLELPEGGPLLQGRMTGVVRGLEQKLRGSAPLRVVHLNGKGERAESARAVSGFLRAHPKLRKVLASAMNDESGQGVLDAVSQHGIAATSAIVGHGGSAEVLPLIADPASPYLGTVSFFPERYGAGLVELVSRLLHGDQVPPFHYMPHKLLH